MKQLIDPALLARMYTKSKYAKDFGISRGTLDNRIRRGQVETIEVKGGGIIVVAAEK